MTDALANLLARLENGERGLIDGQDLTTPEPSSNRHPAYRHSWEVGRAEIEGRAIPAAWSRKRAAHIDAGGEFYPMWCHGGHRLGPVLPESLTPRDNIQHVAKP